MRLPYTPADPSPPDPAEAAIVARIQARRAPRPLQPLDRALLHAPAVADGWNAFLGAVRTRTSLAPDLRELAIARVAVCNEAWYEWAHHAPLALAAGVAESALREEGGVVATRGELSAEPAPPGDEGEWEAGAEGGMGKTWRGLTKTQWAVLRYADEMTRNVKVKDETFEELKRLFDEKEIVELTATIACYNCVSRFLVALDVGEKNGTGPGDLAHH